MITRIVMIRLASTVKFSAATNNAVFFLSEQLDQQDGHAVVEGGLGAGVPGRDPAVLTFEGAVLVEKQLRGAGDGMVVWSIRRGRHRGAGRQRRLEIDRALAGRREVGHWPPRWV